MLSAEEIQVRLQAKPDYAAAASHGHVVVLDVRVSDELKRECFAREVINRVQRARKTMDLDYQARIAVEYSASGELAQAITEHAPMISAETLAQSFAPGGGNQGEEHSVDVDGAPLTFWVRVVGSLAG
jgi:isoleucyl-tRNA synthetase